VNKETKGMLIGFIGILIFSLTLPVTKIAVLSFNPYFIAFGRATLAGLIALAYLLYKKEPIPSKIDFIKFVVIALGVVFGFPIFTTIAMVEGSSSHGAVILGMMPLASTVIGVIRFKERPSLGFWLVSLLHFFRNAASHSCGQAVVSVHQSSQSVVLLPGRYLDRFLV
jgi:drug/metabolite transporter (DMT)-like permease